jgi:CRISPR-associated protein Cas5d
MCKICRIFGGGSVKNIVEFKVYGKYALFSDPITRVGGEKFSYQIPTYQALKGILESCYWKPTFIWYIDEVRVMKRIQTESKGVRTIKYNITDKEYKSGNKNNLSFYTYLKHVEYKVRAHFEWNNNRPNLECDRNDGKHWEIAQRMIERGGRRDIFLGARECQAYVESTVFSDGKGYYEDKDDLDFGVMFHGFDYPDETGKGEMGVRLWCPKMSNGYIKFDAPQDIPQNMRRRVKDMKMKQFEMRENVESVESLYEEVSE